MISHLAQSFRGISLPDRAMVAEVTHFEILPFLSFRNRSVNDDRPPASQYACDHEDQALNNCELSVQSTPCRPWREIMPTTATPDTGDEELAYRRYVGRQSAHFSRRLHVLTAACFAAGFVMTLRDSPNARLVAIVQLLVVLHELYQCRHLVPKDPVSETRTHAVKAKMHAFLHLAVVAMIIISSLASDGEGGRLEASWAASASVFLSFLSVADRLPLEHLVKLQIVKLVSFLGCMAFFEIDLKFKEAILIIVVGVGVPYILGVLIECRARQAYVEKRHEASATVYERFVGAHPVLAWLVAAG